MLYFKEHFNAEKCRSLSVSVKCLDTGGHCFPLVNSLRECIIERIHS